MPYPNTLSALAMTEWMRSVGVLSIVTASSTNVHGPNSVPQQMIIAIILNAATLICLLG